MAADRVVRFLGTDSESDGGFEALINLTKNTWIDWTDCPMRLKPLTVIWIWVLPLN